MEYKNLKAGVFIGIGEENYQGWIWTVATRVTYTPFVLAFLEMFLKGDLYWRHCNTPIPDNMKHNTQREDDTTCWN